MALTLKQLLEELENEGVIGDDADAAVERFLKLRKQGQAPSKNQALARTGKKEIDFPYSPSLPTAGHPPVDYGEESKEEALERWIGQECSDPDGLFAGGASAGGIFGDGAIATSTFDPGARQRTAQMRNLRGQHEQTQLFIKVAERLAEKLGLSLDDVERKLPEHERNLLREGRGRRR